MPTHQCGHEIADFQAAIYDIHGIAGQFAGPAEVDTRRLMWVSRVGWQKMSGGKCVNGRQAIIYQ
jgi:hypothetical protein